METTFKNHKIVVTENLSAPRKNSAIRWIAEITEINPDTEIPGSAQSYCAIGSTADKALDAAKRPIRGWEAAETAYEFHRDYPEYN